MADARSSIDAIPSRERVRRGTSAAGPATAAARGGRLPSATAGDRIVAATEPADAAAVVAAAPPIAGRHLAFPVTPPLDRDAAAVAADGDGASALRRAFDTAGRSIAGGVRTAGAAIRGAF
jgi:hypothetical protein